MLVHGTAGVGKDTVCASVVRHSKIAGADHEQEQEEQEEQNEQEGGGGLQLELAAWLQGSTDAALRAQLVSLFETHRPRELAGCMGDQDACLLRISCSCS